MPDMEAAVHDQVHHATAAINGNLEVELVGEPNNAVAARGCARRFDASSVGSTRCPSRARGGAGCSSRRTSPLSRGRSAWWRLALHAGPTSPMAPSRVGRFATGGSRSTTRFSTRSSRL
jgi:hypothetical protein